VVPQPRDRDAGVLSFSAHSVVFTDEDPRWVYDALGDLDCDALAATMNPRFLAAFPERTGRTAETIDAVLVATPLPGTAGWGGHWRRRPAGWRTSRCGRRAPGNARSVRAFQAAGYRLVGAEVLLRRARRGRPSAEDAGVAQ